MPGSAKYKISMNIKPYIFWAPVLLLIILQCHRDRQEPLKELDLLIYGFPISIQAPDSAEIKQFDLIVQKDLTVKKGNDYYVQIFMGDATSITAPQLKADALNATKQNKYFSRVVEEEEKGFIFELKMDSTATSYGFKYFHVQGDKELIFQTGLTGLFDEKQVRRMYNAVKQD